MAYNESKGLYDHRIKEAGGQEKGTRDRMWRNKRFGKAFFSKFLGFIVTKEYREAGMLRRLELMTNLRLSTGSAVAFIRLSRALFLRILVSSTSCLNLQFSLSLNACY